MINVDNIGNALRITSPGYDGTGAMIESYQYPVMKSVSWIKDSKDDYYVIINFIANDKNNSLRIKMGSVDNQIYWTNDEKGAYTAVVAINAWMNPTTLVGALRTANIYNVSATGATNYGVYSVSIANVGAAAGTVNGAILPAGVTISFDGGAMNHQIDVLTLEASGTTFLITELT